jgi:hypothetical protein
MRASDGTLRLTAPVLPLRQPHSAQRSSAERTGLAALFRLRRRKPTTYHRFLAIHIHFAAPHSALH